MRKMFAASPALHSVIITKRLIKSVQIYEKKEMEPHPR